MIANRAVEVIALHRIYAKGLEPRQRSGVFDVFGDDDLAEPACDIDYGTHEHLIVGFDMLIADE
jgi:hypothetical protein